MRLEMTKQIEEAARHASPGKRWGEWLKEMANFQSDLERPPTTKPQAISGRTPPRTALMTEKRRL